MRLRHRPAWIIAAATDGLALLAAAIIVHRMGYEDMGSILWIAGMCCLLAGLYIYARGEDA